MGGNRVHIAGRAYDTGHGRSKATSKCQWDAREVGGNRMLWRMISAEAKGMCKP